jgi:subfamily B ATP-binding cassette protein MsbA
VPVTLMLLFTHPPGGFQGFLAQLALAKVTNDGLEPQSHVWQNAQCPAEPVFGSKLQHDRRSCEVFQCNQRLINAVMRLARDVLTLLALISYLYLDFKLTLIVGFCFLQLPWSFGALKRLYRLTESQTTRT